MGGLGRVGGGGRRERSGSEDEEGLSLARPLSLTLSSLGGGETWDAGEEDVAIAPRRLCHHLS